MWWDILGVERNADIDTIKKSYSALIKAYRPEEHPEKFSEIRQAFEQARKQASSVRCSVEIIEKPLESPEPPVQIEDGVAEKPARVTADTFQPSHPLQISELTRPDQPDEENIITLLECWKNGKFRDHRYIDQVLNHSDTHDFMALQKAGHEVFAWLINNVKPASGFLATTLNMPVKELARLNSLFGWSLKERSLYEQFSSSDLSLVFYGIASGQSARLHINPIVKQKADTKQKSSNTLLESLIQWGTGIILVFLFIMIIGQCIAALSKEKYVIAGIWSVFFYLMLDGLYYSFAGLRKAGILRKSLLTPKVKMWSLAIRQLFLGMITFIVLMVIEFIVFGILYWIGSAITKDSFVFMLTILLPVTYLAYWLNKEIFFYSRLRYYQLIREFERIKLNSR